MRSSGYDFDRVVYTDENGAYAARHVALGYIAASAQDPETSIVAFGGGVLTELDQSIVIDLTLPATGSILGRLLKADGVTPVTSGHVFVEAPRTMTGPYFSAFLTPDALGRFTLATAPVGTLTLNGRDYDSGLVAAGTVTVTAGTTAEPPLVMGSGVNFDVVLQGEDNFRYDLACNGALIDGGTADFSLTDAYDYSHYLSFNGGGLSCFDAAMVLEADREIRLFPSQAGFAVATRRVFVPAGGGYARILDEVTNVSAGEITVRLEIALSFGSQDSTALAVSPAAVRNRYAVTFEDVPGSTDPVLANVFYDNRSLQPGAGRRFRAGQRGSDAQVDADDTGGANAQHHDLYGAASPGRRVGRDHPGREPRRQDRSEHAARAERAGSRERPQLHPALERGHDAYDGKDPDARRMARGRGPGAGGGARVAAAHADGSRGRCGHGDDPETGRAVDDGGGRCGKAADRHRVVAAPEEGGGLGRPGRRGGHRHLTSARGPGHAPAEAHGREVVSRHLRAAPEAAPAARRSRFPRHPRRQLDRLAVAGRSRPARGDPGDGERLAHQRRRPLTRRATSVRLAVALFAFAASAALAQSGGEARLRAMNIAFEPERLVQFAGQGDAAVVEAFLDAGMNPGAIEPRHGATALINASANGHVRIASRLIAAGAALDQADRAGVTPLTAAAYAGKQAVVEMLLARGASPNPRRDAGTMAPLQAAIAGGNVHIVTALIDAGADAIGAGDENPPLVTAAYTGRADILRLLLAAKPPESVVRGAIAAATAARHAEARALLESREPR